MNNAPMEEKELFEDLLTSEKMTTGTYDTFTNECACADIRGEFLNILTEEHQIQADVFDEMKKRGWYPTPEAPQQKIQQAKQKFQNQKP